MFYWIYSDRSGLLKHMITYVVDYWDIIFSEYDSFLLFTPMVILGLVDLRIREM